MADASNTNESGSSDFMSDGQQVTILTGQALANLISIFGSISILLIVIRSKRRQPQGITSRRSSGGSHSTGLYHRILFGLSCYDIIFSLNFAVAPYLQRPAEHLLGAVGSVASCSASGFFGMAAVGSVLYNLNLSFYYHQTIVQGLSEEQMTKKFEIWMHGLPFLFWIIYGSINVALDNLNPWETIRTCGIKPYPTSCAMDRDLSDCERGQDAMKTGYVLPVIIILCSFLSILFTVRVYLSVRSTFAASRKHLMLATTATLSNDTATNAASGPNTKQAAIAASLRKKQYQQSFQKPGKLQNQLSDSIMAPAAVASAISRNAESSSFHDPSARDDDDDGPIQAVASSSRLSGVSESLATTTTVNASQESISLPVFARTSTEAGSTTDRQAERLRMVMVQAILYCTFFIAAVVFMMVMMAVEDIAMIPRDELGKPGWFVLILVETVVVSLCGFANFAIYIRPRYLRWRRAGFTVWESLHHIYQGQTAPTTVRRRSRRFPHVTHSSGATSYKTASSIAQGRSHADSSTVAAGSPPPRSEEFEEPTAEFDKYDDVDYIPPRNPPSSAQEATEEPTAIPEDDENCKFVDDDEPQT